ncbi:hypothetical protein HOLleu_15454 [Holothuria leucospilota]|uniref:Uncharacterized protein n=1 Tax=Holothuria leucospilota TaxID=206669 RepID=A0A9Q1C951_HOLLE|nr:hypothetical protein HOLleu_15454 [Holothuria leucospilota]
MQKYSYLALLDLPNTPQGKAGSPVQRLMGRLTKMLLPTRPSLLKPKLPQSGQHYFEQQHAIQKEEYDRHAKPLRPLPRNKASE